MTMRFRLFRASEYLISPEEDPERFLQGKYFLTPAQDQVKSAFLKDLEAARGSAFFRISGKPGTGKTLLIYDIAKRLSERGRTLIICGEEPFEGLKAISDAIENLDFIFADEITSSGQLGKYAFVLADEALRTDSATLDIYRSAAGEYGQSYIFCTDPAAALHLRVHDPVKGLLGLLALLKVQDRLVEGPVDVRMWHLFSPFLSSSVPMVWYVPSQKRHTSRRWRSTSSAKKPFFAISSS